MAKIGKWWTLSMALCWFVSWAQAADTTVSATVDRNVMEEGDTFILAISVSSGNTITVEDPRLPNLVDLDLINSWQASETRSSFSNGKFQVEQTRTFNYMLAPSKVGQMRIDPIEVVVNGTAHKTQAIDITVRKGSGVPTQPRAQRPRPNDQEPPNAPGSPESLEELDDLFSQLLRRRNNPGLRGQPVNPNDSFFIQVDVDKTKAYAGEQITASWFLYTRGQISDIDTLKYPSLDGFWKEEIDLATRLDFQQEVINGIVYRKALLASYALFPIKAGTAQIDPYQAKCTVITESAFGFGRPFVHTKASKAVPIEVIPVPTADRPADFAGAVGQFSVSASLSEGTVPANQPVTLKVRFDGRGNGKLIELPPLKLPPNVEVYDTKSESKFFKNGQSYKEFEVLLIPRAVGEVVIPPLSVSLFDPATARFYTKQTQEMKLTVTPGTGPQAVESSPLSMEAKTVPQVQANALPELALGWEASAWRFPLPPKIFWPLIYLAVFGVLIWWSIMQFGLLERGKDVAKVVSLRSDKIAKWADKGDWRMVGVEGTNLVYYVLGEVSGLGGGAQELEKLLLKVPPSVRREMEEPLRKLMSTLEALGFAPEAMIGSLKEKSKLKETAGRIRDVLSKTLSLSEAPQTETDGQRKKT
ncbi:MAG: protein BatD [Bdellovibrionales bacterium]|nr:protein BatD [Bdellovibrionales bacterium]